MAEGGRLEPRGLGNDSIWRRENPQLSRRLRPREGGRSIAGGVQPAPQGMRGDTGLAAHYPIRHWTKHFSLQHELQGQQTCRLGLHAHACAQGHSIVKFA